MVTGIILISLTIVLYMRLRLLVERKIGAIASGLERAKSDQVRLAGQNAALKSEIQLLQGNLEETAALYDVTKEICKSLEEDNVFGLFRTQIEAYVQVKDLKFVKQESEIIKREDTLVIPLKIEHRPAGFLVAEGVSAQQKDKFDILVHLFMLGMKRAMLFKHVHDLAITDSLTGALGRRYFLERFKEEALRSLKQKYNFTVLMIDIDFFKQCNDHYGHLVGDAVLKKISDTIKENIRQIDLLGRYGGEEFSVILTETAYSEGKIVAERIRKAVEQAHIRVYDEDLMVTISIGISVFPADGQDTLVLINKADKALYQAKEKGRNRVCVWDTRQ